MYILYIYVEHQIYQISVRFDLSVSPTRPGSETEQPSVTQKPSTPTNATRGRSNQQKKAQRGPSASIVPRHHFNK